MTVDSTQHNWTRNLADPSFLAPKLRLALRQGGSLLARALPNRASIRAERYLRGWEEHHLLREADLAVVSFGKSGRTWLRVLLSRFYQVRYGLPAARLLEGDSLNRLNRAVPRVLFTHDNYRADFTGNSDPSSAYAAHKVLLLVRHPGDAAVSQFFQWKNRMRQRKKIINGYPLTDLALKEFVFRETVGIPRAIRFMNRWAAAFDGLDDLLVVRYETLHTDTVGTLARVLKFTGQEATEAELSECVRFASADNMRKLESETFFRGDRIKPRDPANSDSYKVRRAKVGGYRDYFNSEEIRLVDQMIEKDLSEIYGYTTSVREPRIL